MTDSELSHLNKAKTRSDELKWFERQLSLPTGSAIYIHGRLLNCESIKLVLLAHVRSELEQAMKYYASL